MAAWWREPADLEQVERRYRPAIDGSDPTELFVIEADGDAVGMIQRVWMAQEPAWAAAVGTNSDVDLDFLIGDPALVGHGLGSAAIGQFAEWTFSTRPDVQAVSSVPQQANVASWRALAKAGFERVRAVERLDSDDPGDTGPAYVYLRRRAWSSPPGNRVKPFRR